MILKSGMRLCVKNDGTIFVIDIVNSYREVYIVHIEGIPRSVGIVHWHHVDEGHYQVLDRVRQEQRSLL